MHGVWDNDLIVFVTSNPDTLESLSWGAPCAVDDSAEGLGRVVAGRVWINANWMEEHDDDDNIANFLQQMTHVLGVHYKAYEYWRDPYYGHRYPAVTEKFDNVRGKCVHRLITPNVRAKAGIEFNCWKMDGIELEDSGDDLIPGHHWDKRLMYNDYMVRDIEHGRDTVYSKISLAALADTGWYDINWEYGH